MKAIHICSFSDVELKSKRPKYETLKAAVLKAGRFSCFEASETPYLAGLYTRLCRDPDLLVTNLQFPWTKVEVKAGEQRSTKFCVRSWCSGQHHRLSPERSRVQLPLDAPLIDDEREESRAGEKMSEIMRRMRRVQLGDLLRQHDPLFADVQMLIPTGEIRAFEHASGSVPTIHVDAIEDRMEIRTIYMRGIGKGIPQDAEFIGVGNWGGMPIYIFLKPQTAAEEPIVAEHTRV